MLHGPGKLTYEEDWPTPAVRPGWALVRIAWCGVCGSDLPRTMVTGSYSHPRICGHEFSGTIEEPAPGSHKYKKGDRVAVFPLIPCGTCAACKRHAHFHCPAYNFLGSRCDGAFAEYCLAPEENLLPLPASLDPRVGAFIEPLAVALHTVKRSGIKKGGNALVVGAGAIGILTAAWLQDMGCTVTLAGRSAASRERAARCGIRHVVDIADPAYKTLAGFTHGFECAGSGDALCDLLEKVGPEGTITVVGRDVKECTLSLQEMERFMRREQALLGCWGYDSRDGPAILAALESGRIDPLPLITHEVPLAHAATEIPRMHRKEFPYCKVVVRV